MTEQDFQKIVLQQLSELSSGQKRLEDRLTSLEDRITSLEDRVTSFEKHVDERFAQVDARFDQVEKRFEQVDARFERLEKEMKDGFHRLESLLSEVFGSPIAEGVELYTDRKVHEHEKKFHSEELTAV